MAKWLGALCCGIVSHGFKPPLIRVGVGSVSKWTKRRGCHVGCQEVSRGCTRCESAEFIVFM